MNLNETEDSPSQTTVNNASGLLKKYLIPEDLALEAGLPLEDVLSKLDMQMQTVNL